jgi:hypothetical protein
VIVAVRAAAATWFTLMGWRDDTWRVAATRAEGVARALLEVALAGRSFTKLNERTAGDEDDDGSDGRAARRAPTSHNSPTVRHDHHHPE